MKIYRASCNSDRTEGRGFDRTIGYFHHEEEAEKAAAGKGVMGVGNGRVRPIEIFDTFEDFKKATQ